MTKQKSASPRRDPDLISRLWRDVILSLRLLADGRVSGMAKLIPLLTVLYILSPIDIIPDLLLPFGIVDDMGAFLLGLQMFIRSAPSDIVDQYRGIQPQRAPGTEATPGNHLPDVIEGQYQVLDEGWDNYDEYEDDYNSPAANDPRRR